MANINLIPVMTSNTTPSGVASGSSELSGSPWNLFDQSLSTFIVTEFSTSAFFQYQFASAEIAIGYSLTAFGTNSNEMPQGFNLLASNTGAFAGEEVILDSQTAQTAWGTDERREYLFANTTAYLYYKIDITTDSGTDYITIAEIEIIGASVPETIDVAVSLEGEANISITEYSQKTYSASLVGTASIQVKPLVSVNCPPVLLAGSVDIEVKSQNLVNAFATLYGFAELSMDFHNNTDNFTESYAITSHFQVPVYTIEFGGYNIDGQAGPDITRYRGDTYKLHFNPLFSGDYTDFFKQYWFTYQICGECIVSRTGNIGGGESDDNYYLSFYMSSSNVEVAGKGFYQLMGYDYSGNEITLAIGNFELLEDVIDCEYNYGCD